MGYLVQTKKYEAGSVLYVVLLFTNRLSGIEVSENRHRIKIYLTLTMHDARTIETRKWKISVKGKRMVRIVLY